MNYLSEAKQILILKCLCEGMAVRSAARVVGVSKGAVLRLVKRVGQACERFHHRFVHDVNAKSLELDELFAFVYGKKRCLPEHLKGSPDHGTIWTWLCLDQDSRLILSFHVGGRGLDDADPFIRDVAYRVRGKVQLNTDAWNAYEPAIVRNFRATLMHYATVDKDYVGYGTSSNSPEHRYSPGKIRACRKKAVFGDPDMDRASTSRVERLNLGVRMANQRYRRLTNAHSKAISYHRWALAIHTTFYNWVRPNSAVKMTPAQACGLSECRFSVRDMLHLDMWSEKRAVA